MLAVRFILFVFILLLSSKIALANDVSQFIFTTNSQNIKPSEVSEVLTIQSQDSNGNSVKLSQTGCLHFKSASDTGEFSSSNTNWKPVSELTMNKNTANKNFYYKDSVVGNHVLTVEAALVSCSVWEEKQWEVKQNINVAESVNSNSVIVIEPEKPEEEMARDIVWPTEPQIFANAGQDKTGIVGADIIFSGKALGINKEPLGKARYLWNLGDGSFTEGQKIKHAYRYPGEYIAVLDVSSGEYSSSDAINIKVIPNELKIIEANKDFIKFQNGSKVNLDISEWVIKNGNQKFKFPAASFIKSALTLILSSEVSGIVCETGAVQLLYPNGSLAYEFILANGDVSHSVANTKDIKHSVFDNSIKPIIEETEQIKLETSKSEFEVADEENYQQAAVVFEENKEKGDWKWWMLAGMVGVVGGGGYIISRKFLISNF